MRRMTLDLLLLLASCGTLVSCQPTPLYDCTLTRNKLFGEDEVRTYRIYGIEKRGWLTSDRYTVFLEDGSIIVLQGEWNIELVLVDED